MKILITGGAGFAGHHLVEHILKNTDWEIVIFDKLTQQACGYDRLRDINCFDAKRVHIFALDFVNPISEGVIRETQDIDYIAHLGAETHVDRSIENALPFVMSNAVGTLQMLEYARKIKNLKKFLYFSTDEVFGPAAPGINHKEYDRHNPTNPYAASKDAGEALTLSFANTHKLPTMITNTMNIFGERQYPEKFIPMVIKKLLAGEKITIHSDPTKKISGSRFWIHARNVADAVLFLLDKGKINDRYNIVGEKEVSNLEMALLIGEVLGKEPKYEMVDFHSSRPGHDLRYALDGQKLKDMGWNPPKPFYNSLIKTIKWIVANPKWTEE